MQPVLVTTRAKASLLGIEREHDLVFPVLWHAPVSKEPRQYAISIAKKNLHSNILASAGIFCIHFCNQEIMQKALTMPIQPTLIAQCETIDCHKLLNEPHLECETVHTLDLGDHYLLIGKVLLAKE